LEKKQPRKTHASSILFPHADICFV